MEISSLRCQLLDDVIAFKCINMMSAAGFIHNAVQMSHSLSMWGKCCYCLLNLCNMMCCISLYVKGFSICFCFRKNGHILIYNAVHVQCFILFPSVRKTSCHSSVAHCAHIRTFLY